MLQDLLLLLYHAGLQTQAVSCETLMAAAVSAVLLHVSETCFKWPAPAGESAVPTERGPISSWSWFNMPHTNCGAGKYCDQFMGNVSGSSSVC